MQLLSLLEQESLDLFEHWTKWFNDRRDRLDFHAQIHRERVYAEQYGNYCWFLAEITFMGDDFSPYEEQALLLYRLFAKEFIKLSEAGHKQWVSVMCGKVSFTEPAYVKEAIEDAKGAIENVKQIVDEGRFAVLGNWSNDPSEYRFAILVEDKS